MRRIFFDVSGLLNHLRGRAHYTGIQRVVAMTAQAVARRADEVYLSFVDPGTQD